MVPQVLEKSVEDHTLGVEEDVLQDQLPLLQKQLVHNLVKVSARDRQQLGLLSMSFI